MNKKEWINRALALLDRSLSNNIPQEMDELDWKEEITPNRDKLKKHISAFANQPGGGFLIFGISDSGAVVGIDKKSTVDEIVNQITNFSRDSFEQLVTINHTVEKYNGKEILILYINESAVKPVHLKGKTLEDTFIRTGGTTRKASRNEVGYLMTNSKNPIFEEFHCSKLKSENEIFNSIDIAGLYNLFKVPINQKKSEILKWLETEKMIESFDSIGYYITNLGALTAAVDLNEFDKLKRKNIRVIKYNSNNKLVAEKEQIGRKGYAVGFEGLIKYLDGLLPSKEEFVNGLRTVIKVYPDIALRELIANALIHQDFSVQGSGPMIEIFSNRIEITNPGKLLPSQKIDRLIRTTPSSRNELLASTFRRLNICEERGSGLERAVIHIERNGLPPLRLEEHENSFRVTIFAPRTFAEMSGEERIEACYQHCIIQYYLNDGMTNTTLRERFKLKERQRAMVSRLIKDAIDYGRIKIKEDGNISSKFMKYVPYWA